MDPAFAGLTLCPSCGADEMRGQGRSLRCQRCSDEIASDAHFLDFGGHTPRGAFSGITTQQALMESELVARIYERVWRPAFVRLIAGKGAGARTGGFAGELFIHKHSLAMEDREGPWLDVSCASGLFTRAMAAANPGDLVVGLDISAAMLEMAARRAKGYGNVVLVRGDAHHLPFREGAFGGVNNSGALHVYDDPEQVFREILRVLRPGGVYVGSTFSRATSWSSRALARVAKIRRYEPLDLRAWLSRVGFVDYEEILLGGSFIFRVRKP